MAVPALKFIGTISEESSFCSALLRPAKNGTDARSTLLAEGGLLFDALRVTDSTVCITFIVEVYAGVRDRQGDSLAAAA
jgi:hypothetical protein